MVESYTAVDRLLKQIFAIMTSPVTTALRTAAVDVATDAITMQRLLKITNEKKMRLALRG